MGAKFDVTYTGWPHKQDRFSLTPRELAAELRRIKDLPEGAAVSVARLREAA